MRRQKNRRGYFSMRMDVPLILGLATAARTPGVYKALYGIPAARLGVDMSGQFKENEIARARASMNMQQKIIAQRAQLATWESYGNSDFAWYSLWGGGLSQNRGAEWIRFTPYQTGIMFNAEQSELEADIAFEELRQRSFLQGMQPLWAPASLLGL